VTTISQRASAAITPPSKPKPQRVCCPNCETTFDVNNVGKPRSVEQHKRFWGIVHAAWHYWPDQHEKQFASANDLRVWLTMKAGWRDLASKTSIVGMRADAIVPVVQAAIKAAGNNARVTSHKGQLCVWTPKSIRFDKMRHMEFVALNQSVEDVIKSELGITGDELLEQHKGSIG
jgi:hypothetical protein